MFFLINVIMQSIPAVSTNNPLATGIPLVFVLLLGMTKEAISDLIRRKADSRENSKEQRRILSDRVISIQRSQVQVGDVLHLDKEDEVPADCLLLRSVDAPQTFISTKSLDGETNLKPKQASRLSQVAKTYELLSISIQEPNKNIDEF